LAVNILTYAKASFGLVIFIQLRLGISAGDVIFRTIFLLSTYMLRNASVGVPISPLAPRKNTHSPELKPNFKSLYLNISPLASAKPAFAPYALAIQTRTQTTMG
jgi:hypothetical protein